MLAQRYLERRLSRLSVANVELPSALPDLRRLASIRQITVLTPELLLTPYSLRAVYPTAGQSKERRAEVLGLAAHAARLDPDPLFLPLREAEPTLSPDAALFRPETFPGAVGRAASVIVEQIADAGGRAALLRKDGGLAAVFDLFRSVKPNVHECCLQLQALGIRLLMLDDASEPALPDVETVSLLSDELRRDGGLLRLNGRVMLSLPGDEALPLGLERFEDLPSALRTARWLVRPLFWLPTRSR